MSLFEYWNILKRRRYLFGLPAFGIALIIIFYALSLPAIYRSEATILIEDQIIPEDIVGATMMSYASQQIQLISQRKCLIVIDPLPLIVFAQVVTRTVEVVLVEQ